MTERRRRGTGTIEKMPDGRFRPRLPGKNGARLSPYDTEEEAARVLDAALYALHNGGATLPEGETLASFAEGFLQRRERTHANARGDRSTWSSCIAAAHFHAWPLASIQPPDVRQWRDELLSRKAKAGNKQKTVRRRTLSRSRAQNALNLLRVCLGEAVERALIPSNPADNVKIPRGLGRTHDPWTYLMPEEQEPLVSCPAIDEETRDLYAFFLFTGVRESEGWNVHLPDVHAVRDDEGHVVDGFVVIRYGRRGKATKGKRIRRVHLFGRALGAVERQLERLKSRKNPHRVLWPTQRGERRADGEAPASWKDDLAAAGIVAERRHDGQPVRFHDLRHSCASSLVAEWWGRRWSLEEVRDLLGHRSITTTQRYAHLAESTLSAAARETAGPAPISPSSPHGPEGVGHVSIENHSAPPRRLERPTNGLGSRSSSQRSREDGARRGEIVGRSALAHVEALATEALEAAASGGLGAWRAVEERLVAIVRAAREARGDEEVARLDVAVSAPSRSGSGGS